MKQITYCVNENPLAKGKTDDAKKNVAFGWEQRTTSVAEFLQYAAVNGNAIMPGILRNKTRDQNNIEKFCIVIVDVDNKRKPGVPTMSFDEAMDNQWLQENAICLWSSPSDGIDEGTDDLYGQDRYRILFKLKEDFKITDTLFSNKMGRDDRRTIRRVIDTLHNIIDGADPDMVWCNPIFGTIGAKKVHTFSEENTLDINTLEIDEPEPKKVTRRDLENTLSKFNGSKDQSVSNIRDKFLAVIPSDESMKTWLSVGAMLGNIAYHDLDYETGLELYQEWSHRDYPESKEDENRRVFDKAYDNPGTGSSFSSLKALAMEYGYEPNEYSPVTTDPGELFGKTDGYKVTDVVHKKPGLTVDLEGKVFVRDLRGINHEVTYAKTTTLMTKDVIPVLEAVTNDHEYRFNTATMGVMCDGVEMSGEELDNIQYALSREYGINFPKDTKGALTRIAMENSYDPYIEELETIEKNVSPMDISNLATRYFKASNPLADVMMEKWLVSLVGRLLKPGLNSRGALVVVGEQNIGKDAFLQTLVNGPGRIVSVGSKTNLKDVNFMLACSTAWVANLDEIEKVTKHQIEGELKSWLTQTEDRFAVKYKMYGKTYPRRFSVYGSCNNANFLQDPTGNTRYWVIESGLDYIKRGERVDIHLLAEERDAILAAAIAKFRLFQKGEYELGLSFEESQVSEEFNKGFVEDAAYVSQLQTKLLERTTTCWAEVCEMLYIDTRSMSNKVLTNQIRLSLSQLGWKTMKTPRKIRKKNYPDLTMKLIVRDEEFINQEEIHSFLMKPDQRWYGLNKTKQEEVEEF